jgi:hypothetical protein
MAVDEVKNRHLVEWIKSYARPMRGKPDRYIVDEFDCEFYLILDCSEDHYSWEEQAKLAAEWIRDRHKSQLSERPTCEVCGGKGYVHCADGRGFPCPTDCYKESSLQQRLADAERRCGELLQGDHKTWHVCSDGNKIRRFPRCVCSLCMGNSPDEFDPVDRIAALESQREWPKLIKSGDTIPSGHKIVYVNRFGGWGVQRGPLFDMDGLFYYDLGPLPPPEARE